MRKVIIFMLLTFCSVMAKDFLDKKYLFGVHARVGAPMGGGVEFAFPIIKGNVFEWRNFLGIEAFGTNLIDTASYDGTAMLFHEKMTFSYLVGSSVASAIGFSYFKPYLYVGGGFGLIGSKYNTFGNEPYYAEVSAGIGHEFITERGHTFFFEFGGGSTFFVNALPQQKQTTKGITKVLLGYRIYF